MPPNIWLSWCSTCKRWHTEESAYQECSMWDSPEDAEKARRED
jgi:hypothetical protein